MNLTHNVQLHRDQILQLAASHGARDVRIFGSVARNEATPTSDVDLLVKMDNGKSYLDFVALWQDLEELLKRSVDVVAENGVSPYLKERIIAEARPL